VVLFSADRSPTGAPNGVQVRMWSEEKRWVVRMSLPSIEPTPASRQFIVPLWLPWLPIVAGCVLTWRRWLVGQRQRARSAKPCPACGYELAALPSDTPCPECGEAGEPAAHRPPASDT
jgi:hypothetical protein